MNKTGAKIILWVLILAMLGFTVVRTLHFLQQTFPPNQQYVAYLALAAFDVGILGWLYYAMHAAEGNAQRTVAYGMIFVCGLGVIITTIADMLMVSNANGLTTKMPPDIATVALWAVMIVISLNVAAGILVHLVDPKHQRHMAKESARDIIHAASLSAISQRAGEIAPRIADRVAAAFEDEIVQEMIGHLPSQRRVVASTLASASLAQTASASSLPEPKSEDEQKGGSAQAESPFRGSGS